MESRISCQTYRGIRCKNCLYDIHLKVAEGIERRLEEQETKEFAFRKILEASCKRCMSYGSVQDTIEVKRKHPIKIGPITFNFTRWGDVIGNNMYSIIEIKDNSSSEFRNLLSVREIISLKKCTYQTDGGGTKGKFYKNV